MMKHNDLNRGRVFAAGFGNGVVRICSLDSDNITIINTFKAHDTAVVRCLYNEQLTYFVTCSKDGDIFIFNIVGDRNLQKYEPFCMIKIPDETQINDMKWNNNEDGVYVACQNGSVYEIVIPSPSKVDNKETYLFEDA